jgi:hypothetical protein
VLLRAFLSEVSLRVVFHDTIFVPGEYQACDADPRLSCAWTKYPSS